LHAARMVSIHVLLTPPFLWRTTHLEASGSLLLRSLQMPKEPPPQVSRQGSSMAIEGDDVLSSIGCRTYASSPSPLVPICCVGERSRPVAELASFYA
jgi:hypothetical protein